MTDYIKKIGRNSIIISVLVLVLSIFMFTQPVTIVNILLIFFGYILVVDGIIHFVSYFAIDNENRFYSYELAQSIIYIVLGFLIVCNSNAVSQSITVIFGIWIVIESILKFQISMNIRSDRNVPWGIMLIMTFVSALLGIALIFKPFASMEAIIRTSGAILAITQLIDIFNDFYILSQVGKATKPIKSKKESK